MLNRIYFPSIALWALFVIVQEPSFAQRASQCCDFDSASVKQIVERLAKYHKVRVCNPKAIKGPSLTCGFSRDWSLTQVIDALSHILSENETKYSTYLLLQNKVIYVADEPFTIPFVADKMKWPCANRKN